MKALILALTTLVSYGAHATGGFNCEYQGGSLKFELSGVTSRSFASDIVDANAMLTGTVGDDGLIFEADQKFVKSDVRQYWNSDDEFRIVLYTENEANGRNTTITIKTATPDSTEIFGGTITINQSSPKGNWSIEDQLECGIE